MAYMFQHARLGNGLTVIAETDPLAETAAVGFFVKTGARDEPADIMGVSHFLEHMMFKGTARRSAEQLNRDFDRIGARSNAYTTHEMTCFHAGVLPEKFADATEIVADMLRPAVRGEDFDVEKGVILEEIAMYEDNPFWVLYERVLEECHVGHPLGHRVLGTRETVTGLTAHQMRAYLEARYSSDNTVVAAAGRVDFGALVGQVEGLCGTWTRTGTKREHGAVRFVEKRFEMRSEKVSRAYWILIAPGPSATDMERYAAGLLAQVLGGPDNSRLHWELIETGLAEQAEAGYDPRDRAGHILVSFSGDPERAGEIEERVLGQVAALGDSLMEDDLGKIRAKAATGMTVHGERPGGRMQRLGRQWMYQEEYTTLEEELDRLNRVTVEDLREVLRKYPLGRGTVGVLLPEEGVGSQEAGRATQG